MATSEVYCDDCGEPLEPHDGDPDDRPPCPECGSTARRFVEQIEDTVSISDNLAAKRTRVREWVETNWPVLLAAAVLTVASYLLGGWIGLLVGAAASTIGVEAFTKVQEREVERF